MNVEYITHASLLVRSETVSLLTDPCYFLEPFFATSLFHFPPRKIAKDTLGKLNYVYSSHIHVDHSHPETLKQLKEQVDTVLLPAQRPDLEKRYRDLGYHKIILLQNGETLKLNEELEVTSYWDDLVDTILIVKIKDKTILHQNDCLLKPKTLAKIAERFAIDYAFMLYTSFANHQPTLLYAAPEEIGKQVAEDEESFLQTQLDFIKIIKPKTIVPYSMTLSYCQRDRIALNGYERMTPTIFKNKLLAHLPEAKCWIVQPGDTIDLELDRIQYHNTKNFWGENLQEFLQNIAEYVEEEKIANFDFGNPDRETIESFLQRRLTFPFSSIFADKIVAIDVIGNRQNLLYLLDLANKKISVEECERTTENYFIKLSIPASILEQLILKRCEESMLDFVLYSNLLSLKINYEKNLSVKARFGLLVRTIISLFGDRNFAY
jgi:L-ascorbate metabolism protein UlaG (beta-lactamase superfamily)